MSYFYWSCLWSLLGLFILIYEAFYFYDKRVWSSDEKVSFVLGHTIFTVLFFMGTGAMLLCVNEVRDDERSTRQAYEKQCERKFLGRTERQDILLKDGAVYVFKGLSKINSEESAIVAYDGEGRIIVFTTSCPMPDTKVFQYKAGACATETFKPFPPPETIQAEDTPHNFK